MIFKKKKGFLQKKPFKLKKKRKKMEDLKLHNDGKGPPIHNIME